MSYWPCEHLSDKFLKSCQNNNLEDVKACIQLKVDVNVKRKDCSKYFGLSYAAWYNFPDLCDVLLSHPSIDVNNKGGGYDGTALMRSCGRGYSSITQKLLASHDIDVNCQDSFGRTAAMWAVANNHPDCVQLLSHRQDVNWNLQDIVGETAAMRGVYSNRVTCIEILTHVAGVDWNIKNIYGESCLTLALEGNKTEIVQLLLSVPSLVLNIEELKKVNLYTAAVEECRKYVTGLQEKDNKKMTDFDSPIVFAIKHQRLSIAKMLAESSGVDINLE